MSARPLHAAIPSVDRVLRSAAVQALIQTHGRTAVADAVRDVLAARRRSVVAGTAPEGEIAEAVGAHLQVLVEPSLRRVFNLTGTVLHTNLGRAPLPDEAIAAVAAAAGACNLEYELDDGRRGDRDSHVEDWLCRLTGAEAATAVNNNAAAVLLVLNTLALGKEVPVSRGELIEIGGAFRMPEIMARAGCRLHEVGTTNRTHRRDFEAAVGPDTALLMKVHPSNYAIQGFSAAVSDSEMASLAQAHGLPYVVDLGSGQLVDLRRWGLPHEPTVREALAAGADLVTFSGDKLLGGPQAGLVVGRADLVAQLKRNPLKRAMRLDKMSLAALGAVLRLYADPDRLAQRLPTLRLLARAAEEIAGLAERLRPEVARAVGREATVEVVACASQIGSGSLPVDRLPSAALALRPAGGRRGRDAALKRLSEAFRRLPIPVIGRVQDDALLFDLRCLEDEDAFLDQLGSLAP